MKSMHKTSAGEKRNDLQMTAQGLAQDDRALQEATRAPAARTWGKDCKERGGSSPGRDRGLTIGGEVAGQADPTRTPEPECLRWGLLARRCTLNQSVQRMLLSLCRLQVAHSFRDENVGHGSRRKDDISALDGAVKQKVGCGQQLHGPCRRIAALSDPHLFFGEPGPGGDGVVDA
jgi:hypothetical protein